MPKSQGRMKECHVWEEALQNLKFCIKCGDILGPALGDISESLSTSCCIFINISLGLLYIFHVLEDSKERR